MSYRYFIYGLHVESEIEINEAMADSQNKVADVTVKIGSMPDEVREKMDKQNDSMIALICKRDGLCFRVPAVGDYLVEEKCITIEPFIEPTSQPIKTFLLGSAFGYCMVLRKKVVMHGGAVEHNGKGIIVTGESGAGKSTVTNALRERGYLFIADDVCALAEDGEKMHISMAYPQQKLCRDAAMKMGYDLSELIYINEHRDKFAVRLKDGILPEGADFSLLFELRLSEDGKLSCQKVEGHEKLFTIIRNIYRGESAFDMWGMPPEYMKRCLKIVSTIEVYQISRPADINTLDEILQIIAEKIDENTK